MIPPDVKENYSDNNAMVKASLISYNQIREYEIDEDKLAHTKAICGVK